MPRPNIEAFERLFVEATRGTWMPSILTGGSVVSPGVPDIHKDDGVYYGGALICETVTEANARFISASHNFMPALCEYVKHLEARIAALETK